MEGRCYVCRTYGPTRGVMTCLGALRCCDSCVGALTRVAELELRERSLVRQLRDVSLGQGLPQPKLERPVVELISGSIQLLDALRRFVEVTDPSNGFDSGHALERVERDDGSVTYACVMPTCRVCAASGLARTLLSATEGSDASDL